MKILLFGGSGQLGFEIQKRCLDLNFELISPVISEVDVVETEQVMFLAGETRPDLIINAAAYTAVDPAEKEIEQAFKLNRDGAANVARAARANGARLIQISTDYVFDGTASAPINELAATNPLSVYGASKLAGEIEVHKILEGKELVVRTSSLHGQKGINFVHTMLKLFAEKPVVKVVKDQTMSPTWAGWLAEVVLDLGRVPVQGVIHASCAGAISWFDFASEILNLTREQAGFQTKLEPITAEELARPAKRPKYSVFDCTKLSGILKREPIGWKVGLRAHLRELGYELAGD